MSMLDLYQVNYQTVDHISTRALTQFWGAVDAANRAGYVINHSNDPHTLMIDPSHLYDVAEALGYAITAKPETMVAEFKRLTWPRFIGTRKFRTSIWPSGKSVNCWTFDLIKSESTMDQLLAHQSIADDQLAKIEHTKAQLTIWRDTINHVPKATEISYNAGELSTLLSGLIDQLNSL